MIVVSATPILISLLPSPESCEGNCTGISVLKGSTGASVVRFLVERVKSYSTHLPSLRKWTGVAYFAAIYVPSVRRKYFVYSSRSDTISSATSGSGVTASSSISASKSVSAETDSAKVDSGASVSLWVEGISVSVASVSDSD